MQWPCGLAFDRAGDLYVSAGGIYRISPDATVSYFAGPVGWGAWPSGLAFDSQGNLYGAFAEDIPPAGSIKMYTPDGLESVFTRATSEPFWIAIQVPEPSATALLGIGLSALLVFRRRT